MGCSAILRNYSRYLLVFFNFIFVITGVILISVGLSAKAYYHEFDTFLDHKYIYISDLLIIIGVIIFFIAFFGCCGAIKENACMTTTFSTLLIGIFILEVVAAVSGILLKSKTEEFLARTLRDTMEQYGNPNFTEITSTWDNVQRQFDCCGVTNYTDWNITNTISTDNELPVSCCKILPGTVYNFTCTPENVYPEGCLEMFGDYVRTHTSVIEGVGIAMAIIQLLGIVLACYLAKSIRSDYETV